MKKLVSLTLALLLALSVLLLPAMAEEVRMGCHGDGLCENNA